MLKRHLGLLGGDAKPKTIQLTEVAGEVRTHDLEYLIGDGIGGKAVRTL